MPIQNLGVFNRPYYVKNFSNNLKQMNKEEQQFYLGSRDWLGQHFNQGMPIQQFSFTTQREQLYPYNPQQQLANVNRALEIQKGNGRISIFDLETLGMFKGGANGTATPFEQQLQSITELSIVQDQFSQGEKTGRQVFNYAFGISPSQKKAYDELLMKFQTVGASQLTAIESSTLERLARYGVDGAVEFNSLTQLYEVKKIGESSIADLDRIIKGYQKLLEVGVHQGIQTQRGKVEMVKAVRVLQGSEMVSGYNINVFDIPFLNSTLQQMGLNPVKFKSGQLLDGLEVLRTTAGHDIKGMVEQLAKRVGVENFNPGKSPGRLETIARALGLQSMDHLAEADNVSLFEFLFYQPHFGSKGNLTFLEDAQTTLTAKTEAFKHLPTLTHANKKETVIYANQSLYVPKNRYDYHQINGVKQTDIDYAINRGEYYKLDEFNFLSRERIEQLSDKELGTQMLNELGDADGLYMMKLSGASKYNNGKESFIFRHNLDEFEHVFKKLNIFELTKNQEEIGTSFNKVTQKMVDQQTKVAVHDRLRREVMGYFSEGDRQYQAMRKMYLAYDEMEKGLEKNGYKVTKENVSKLIHDQLPELKKEEIFDPIFKNSKVKTTPQRRYQTFEEMFGFLKSSRVTMGEVFNIIESNVNVESLKRLFYTQSPLNESSMESFIDVMRTKALGAFMENFEMENFEVTPTSSSIRTMRDAFELSLPRFNAAGQLLEETTRINFFDVNSATSSLMNLLSGGAYQKTVGAAQTQKIGEAKQLLDHLAKQGLISTDYVNEIYNNTNIYDIMKKVAYDINHSFQSLYQEMGYGAADVADKHFQVNAMMEMLNQKQEKQFSPFAEGVYRQWVEHPTERMNLNIFNVALKNPTNKTQKTPRGLDSFVKRNKLDIQSMVLEAVSEAKRSNQWIFDKSPKSFNERLKDKLQNEYGYTDENIESFMDILYGRRISDDKRLSGGLLNNQKNGRGMMVQLFDDDGQLKLIATTEQKAGLVNRMLYKAQREGALDTNLKNHALVLNLPQYEKNHPGQVFRMGTVYKVSETQLKPRLMGSDDDLTPASQRVILTLQNTIDESLQGFFHVNKIMSEHIANGDFMSANQVVQKKLNDPIMKASSYTGRQTIMKDGKLHTAVIPNTKDLLSEHTIGMGYFRTLMPFLYEKDELVRGRINDIFKQQRGWSPSRVQKKMNEEVEGMKNYKFKSFEESDLGVALKEYFTVNLIEGDRLISRVLDHSLDLPIETTQALQSILEHQSLNQVLSEKNVQQFRVSTVNQPSLIPYAVTNDLSRPAINQSLTYLHYNLNDVTEAQRQDVERLGIYMGDRIATREGLQVKSKLLDHKDYHSYENSLFGGLKAMSTSDIKREVHALAQQKDQLMQRFGVSEAVIDDVLGSLGMIGTYEGGGVIHPTIKKTFFNYPELFSFKVSESQLAEEELDQLVGQVISGDGRMTVNGKSIRLDYDKKVAGRIASRSGDTLFVEALDRNIHETKISFGGVEKMMLQDPSSFLLNPNDESLRVLNELWDDLFGKVAIVANPEFLKHESSGIIAGSYLNQAFMYLQTHQATQEEQEIFLNIVNKHLPSWNFSIEPNLRGEMSLIMNGMPTAQTGNLEGIYQALKDMEHYADHQRTVGGGNFVGMMDDLKRAQDENVYYSLFQRLTSSESPGMAVKHQARANQVFSSKMTVDYEGKVAPITYKDATGKVRQAAEPIIQYEKFILSDTQRAKKGQRFLSSIQTAIAGMQGKADDYGIKGRILSVNVDDLPILPRGISAENIGADFYQNVVGITDDVEVFKVNLENFKVSNPMTKELEDFIYLPRVNTEIIDGHAVMVDLQKRVNDLLQAVDLLKNRGSDKTTEGLMDAVQTAYEKLVGSYYDELYGDNGIMKTMVLEGHLPFSTRALGAQIVAPVTPELMAATTLEEKRQVIQQHLKDIEENQGRNIHFVDDVMENHVRSTNEKGELILRDVAEVSERQLKDMGVDLTDVGRQVVEDDALNGGAFKQKLIAEGILTPDGNYSTLQKEVDTLEVYEERLRKQIAKKTGKELDQITLTPKQLEKAKRQRGRALAKLKQAQQEEEIEFFTSIGRRYMEEVGHLGTIIRDPAFQRDSKNVALYLLNPRLKGKVVRITSVSSGRMKQDVDGDTDGLQLFLEKTGIERTVDEYGNPYIRTKTRLLNDNSSVIQGAKQVHEGDALTNATVHFADALKTELMDGKGNFREKGQALFEDLLLYIKQLRKTRQNEAGEIVDNLMLDSERTMRAVKNRQNKEAIGYLSNPNHLIRDISNVVYEGDNFIHERNVLAIFTQIAEQDLISVKHVKDAATELTPVEKFNRGIQSLLSTNVDERNDGIRYVIEALDGSVFKNGFLPTVEEIVTKTNRAVNSQDRLLTEGIMSLNEMMQTEQARSIYNSKFIKGRTLTTEQKIEALKEGMGNLSSPLLDERRAALMGSVDLFTDESGESIKDYIFSYSGNKDRQSYSTDFYKIKSNGVSSSQRPYLELENLTDGSSIYIRGATKEAIATELNESFQIVDGAISNDLRAQLQASFEANYQAQGMKDYEQFVAYRLESSLAETTQQFRAGNLTEAQYQQTIQQVAAPYVDEFHLPSYSEQLRQRLQSRNELELKGMANLSQTFYETETGELVESFAQTATYLRNKGMASEEQTKTMIRQMNDMIRRGVDPDSAKISSIHSHTSNSMELIAGQLRQLESEAQGVGLSFAFGNVSPEETVKSLQQTNQMYDLAEGGQRFLSNLQTQASQIAAQEGIQNQEVIDGAIRETYENFMESQKNINESIKSGIQQKIEHYSRTPELLGWVDTEAMTRQLGNYDEAGLRQSIQTLESAVVGYGQYAGINIGQLSMEQLRGTLDEVSYDLTGEAKRQTEAHISTYLDFVDQLGDRQLLDEINGRHFEPQRRMVSDEMINEGVKQLNNNIRVRAAQATSQASAPSSSMKIIKENIESFKSNWTTKHTVLGMAAAAATLGVVGMLSGHQFTATPKAIDAKRQGREEYQEQVEAPASKQWQEVAPQTQHSTYLMQDQPLNYQIRARSNGRYSPTQHANFITQALKPNRATVTTRDNREELSEHWLTNQLNELL